MLYSSRRERSRLQRIHAPFVTEKEISAVTEFWRKRRGQADYVEGFLEGLRRTTKATPKAAAQTMAKRTMRCSTTLSGWCLSLARRRPRCMQRRLRDWLWPRRSPDRHDGARWACGPSGWIEAPRDSQVTELLRGSRCGHAVATAQPHLRKNSLNPATTPKCYADSMQ